jgi:hypothetical protein
MQPKYRYLTFSLFIAVAALVGYGVQRATAGHDSAAPSANSVDTNQSTQANKTAVNVALAKDEVAARASMGGRGAYAPVLSPEIRALHASTDFAELLRSVDNGSIGLAPRASSFLRALILERCSNVDMQLEEFKRIYAADLTTPEGVNRLRTIYAMKSPSEPQKIAANKLIERHLPVVCRRFAGHAPTAAEVRAAYLEAAKSGDTRAQIWALDDAILARSKQADWLPDDVKAKAGLTKSYEGPNPQEMATLLTALKSGDPITVLAAGQILSRGSENGSINLMPANIDLTQNATEIWKTVACSYGFDCGADSTSLLEACARGSCAPDYVSLLRDYELTGEQFRRVESAAQQIVAAIEAGKLSDVVVRVARAGDTIDLTGRPIYISTR